MKKKLLLGKEVDSGFLKEMRIEDSPPNLTTLPPFNKNHISGTFSMPMPCKIYNFVKTRTLLPLASIEYLFYRVSVSRQLEPRSLNSEGSSFFSFFFFLRQCAIKAFLVFKTFF